MARTNKGNNNLLRRCRIALDNLAEGIVLIGENGRIELVNQAFCDMFDLAGGPAELAGRDPGELLEMVAPLFADPGGTLARIREILAAGHNRKDEEIALLDGREFLADFAPLTLDGNPGGRIWQLREVTERKQAEEACRLSESKYRELSITDDLTRLYNLRHFYGQLQGELDRAGRYGSPVTLVLFDIDNFKRFNDTYGHIEGDRVLARLGEVVRRCLRRTDSAYRYGGEEFVIILPATDCAGGVATAERLRTELAGEQFSPEPGKDVRMTLSIGVGQYQPRETLIDFVRRVDRLMYRAKKDGKDRISSE